MSQCCLQVGFDWNLCVQAGGFASNPVDFGGRHGLPQVDNVHLHLGSQLFLSRVENFQGLVKAKVGGRR